MELDFTKQRIVGPVQTGTSVLVSMEDMRLCLHTLLQLGDFLPEFWTHLGSLESPPLCVAPQAGQLG